MISLPRDRMDQLVKRFDMLEAQMAAGPEPEAYVKLASEYAELQDMAGKIRDLRAAEKEVSDLEAMVADRGTDSEMRELAEAYAAGEIDWLDGISVNFPDWWFNVRPSNTEPLLRLVVEARTPADLKARFDELVARIGHPVDH